MSDVTPPRPSTPPETSLGALVAWLGDRLVGTLDPLGDGRSETVLTGLTLSSQQVLPGDLYAALPGSRVHGARYLVSAVAAGAAAVLTDAEGARIVGDQDVPVLVVDRPRSLLGDLAARMYGAPAEALRLLAVTGTQGKTTSTWLAESGLRAAGTPAAVVGTVGTRINGEAVASRLTTPEAPDLHALFAVMRERAVQACAIEVSSHALVMGRVDGVVFDVAAFTNLGRDHLDFHADVEEYFSAKASLFTPERARLGLVNVDDEHGRRLVADPKISMRTLSTAGGTADWSAFDVEATTTGSTFMVRTPDGGRFRARVAIPGAFNVTNALTAIAGLAECGFDPEAVAEGIGSSGGVPGRLEVVSAGQDFLAVVDYAHKPDAVAAALTALSAQTAGRLIVVLGAGGERDPGKREVMGEIAGRLADVLVVTDDNPRTEDPAAIRAAILAGAASVAPGTRAETHESADRREAIRTAVSLAGPGDTLVVAGKGHETGQEVAGAVLPFDDRGVLREVLGEAVATS